MMEATSRGRAASVAVVALATLLAAGCKGDAAPAFEDDGAKVAISVAPLRLAGISDVGWTLTVENAAGQTVWTRTIGSAQFGAGDGSASYVGPCDPTENPNRVTIQLASMTDADGELIPPSDYATPPPATKSVTCEAQGDTAVSFDLTIARAANQGFFDVAVTFDDVFCSAKLDCLGDDGQPIELLHNGDERDTTIVVAWACTTGAETQTYLHMDALVFECSDGTRVVHNPSQGPGNVGGDAPYIFQRAVYRGREQLEPYDKCYWNHAFGVDLDAIPDGVDCTISGRATASPTAWIAGNTPEGAIWPMINWNVPVVTDGALSCGHHALNAGPEVSVSYTSQDGARFFYSMACEDDPTPVPNGAVCAGTVNGFGESVVFAGTEEGVVLAVGAKVTDPMPLPPGMNLIEECCLDPCCVAE